MKQKGLKLFVWIGFCPDYTDGLAFAIAKDEAEAQMLVTKGRGYDVYEWGKLSVLPLNKKYAASVPGGG